MIHGGRNLLRVLPFAIDLDVDGLIFHFPHQRDLIKRGQHSRLAERVGHLEGAPQRLRGIHARDQFFHLIRRLQPALAGLQSGGKCLNGQGLGTRSGHRHQPIVGRKNGGNFTFNEDVESTHRLGRDLEFRHRLPHRGRVVLPAHHGRHIASIGSKIGRASNGNAVHAHIADHFRNQQHPLGQLRLHLILVWIAKRRRGDIFDECIHRNRRKRRR